MRALLLLAAVLLVGYISATVTVGRFQTWAPSSRVPLTFTSNGVTVSVAPLPCPVPATRETNESCRYDGYDNQGAITVSALGAAPVRTITDRQSEYARIAVVRFSRRDPRPGVVIESQYGGSAGVLTVELLVPTASGFSSVSLPSASIGYPEGQLADRPADLSGDGVTDFVLNDGPDRVKTACLIPSSC